jgi:hypothetical protein
MLFAMLLACVITDGAGNECALGEAVSDGLQSWCPQPDSPEVCGALADDVVAFERRCLATTLEDAYLHALVEQQLGCDDAVVVLPQAASCRAQLRAHPCVDKTALPEECAGVLLGG